MTFVDLVFPAFLFIVGMSMPFSIGRRIEKGESHFGAWKHIIKRVFGLLIIGVLMVNSDRISDTGVINPHLWIFLMYICVIIIWNKNNATNRISFWRILKYAATTGLVILFFLFQGEHQSGLIQMRTYWWGIIGLIGWAYLIACLFYVPLRKNQFALLSGMVLLYCFYLVIESGMLIHVSFLRDLRQAGAMLGSHAAIVLSGVILGNKLRENIENPNHKNILQRALGFSAFLFIAGMLLHQLKDIHIMFIIDKDNGTVPWCLISSAFTIWIWMLIYWLVDIKGLRKWTTIIEPAGTNPLFAYILAPFVGECLILISYLFGGFNFYEWLGQSFYIGFFRSIALALSMTWLTGYLSKKGIQLKV